ncbi:hypothetical protein RRG08_012222 [Elysia crispata]|uniref:Uncharacterized protein n=1 Tax=Elysia crispata TaxID=231223 RepID=A0AAE0Z678_9GAST|nr:hypothetical protein RRG08_012222 [Elysia crispata]
MKSGEELAVASRDKSKINGSRVESLRGRGKQARKTTIAYFSACQTAGLDGAGRTVAARRLMIACAQREKSLQGDGRKLNWYFVSLSLGRKEGHCTKSVGLSPTELPYPACLTLEYGVCVLLMRTEIGTFRTYSELNHDAMGLSIAVRQKVLSVTSEVKDIVGDTISRDKTKLLRRSITRGSVQYNRVVVFHHTWECAVQQSCGVPSHVRVCSTTELRCSITRGNVQYNRVAVFHHTWECAVQQSCGVPSHVGVCSTTELRCSITRGSVQYNRVAVFHHTWECAVQQSCGVPSHVGVCSVRNKSGETRV